MDQLHCIDDIHHDGIVDLLGLSELAVDTSVLKSHVLPSMAVLGERKTNRTLVAGELDINNLWHVSARYLSGDCRSGRFELDRFA